jgi:hypothetical protein
VRTLFWGAISAVFEPVPGDFVSLGGDRPPVRFPGSLLGVRRPLRVLLVPRLRKEGRVTRLLLCLGLSREFSGYRGVLYPS